CGRGTRRARGSTRSRCSELRAWRRAGGHADLRSDADADRELRLRRVLDALERGALELLGRHFADDPDGHGRADPERDAHGGGEWPREQLRVATERVDDQAAHGHRLAVAPQAQRADLADERQDQQEPDREQQDERDRVVEPRSHHVVASWRLERGKLDATGEKRWGEWKMTR